MKNLHLFTLLVAGVVLAVAIATYEPAPSSDEGMYSFTNSYGIAPVTDTPHPDVVQPTTKAVGDTSLPVSLTPAFSYTIGKVRLMGDEGTRPFPAELSVTELTAATLPPLDQGMVNVTDYAAGYRMLPDGMVFNGDISIVLPYDSTLLPAGFTPDDIVTYYYDVRIERWTAIGRDSVSTADALVYSKVNHFTDFINAVIKTPEMPETSAFTPTSIKELEAANPLEGLQLIQAPTANNSGTANLSYQLEIPAGRQGMQPNLALTYSSSGGNGWLGVGWDISVPSITVETRWGVPRYESSWESEVYVYGGEQLLMMNSMGYACKMPHRTNQSGQTLRTPGTKHFVTRAGEAHDSIVRHGNSTQDYWWEVVDRNGVTCYYGAYPPGDNTHGPTSIGGSDGIARWALAATVDPNGNMVRYYYSMDYHAGAGGEMGKQLYLDSINYTGYYSRTDSTAVPGAYTVAFHRDSPRMDVTTNARYGFKEVTAATLCNVEVLFNGKRIRLFPFITVCSRKSNYKTRLNSFYRIDGNPEVFFDVDCFSESLINNVLVTGIQIIRYDFEYYDYPSTDDLFSAEVVQNFPSDGISSSFLTPGYSATALGSTKGKSWSVGGSASFGVGANTMLSTASIGGNFDYGQSQTAGTLSLIDLNGDGLADKVFKKDGRVYYRPQVRLTDTTFNFGDTVRLSGISDFLSESGDNVTWGLQLSVAVASANASFPMSHSTTDTYFADINGDGLPDLVTPRGAMFNRLNLQGHPYFTPYNTIAAPLDGSSSSNCVIVTSNDPCDPGIINDGEVSPDLGCTIVHDTLLLKNPQLWADSSLSWVAQGYVCDTVLIDNTPYLQGVKSRLLCDYDSEDPDMDAVRIWVAPRSGWVLINSQIQLVEDTTESRRQSRYADGVSYSIQHSHGMGYTSSGISAVNSRLVLRGGLEEDNYLPRTEIIDSIYMDKMDLLFFRLSSNSNHLFDRVQWRQNIIYHDTAAAPDINCERRNIYHSGTDYLLSGNEAFKAVRGGQVRISGVLSAHDIGDSAVVTVRKNNMPYLTYRLSASVSDTAIVVDTTFLVAANDEISFVATSPSGHPNWSNFSFSPVLKHYAVFSDSIDAQTDSLVFHLPVNYHISRNLGIGEDTLHDRYRKLFGPLFRGWGQFAYHNNYDASDSIIRPYRLVLPQHLTAEAANDLDTSFMQIEITSMSCADDLSSAVSNSYQPLSDATSWVQMSPSTEYGAWVSYGNVACVSADGMSNTRTIVFAPTEDDEPAGSSSSSNEITIYDNAVPVSQNGERVTTIRRRSKSKQTNFGAGVGFVASVGRSWSNGYSQTLSDYMDLNGDRYPDFVGESCVQYTTPWGGIAPDIAESVGSSSGSVRSNVSSNGITMGATYANPKKMLGFSEDNSKYSAHGSGIGVSRCMGKDETEFSYIDINGDGLPDRLFKNGGVQLNMGYGFRPAGNWNTAIRTGSSLSRGINAGASFNMAQNSISGGLGLNLSDNQTTWVLMDVNGDGLPDKVEQSSSCNQVCYQLGEGRWSSPELLHNVEIGRSTSYTESLNLGVTVGFTVLSIAKVTVGVQVSPFNRSFSKDDTQLVDINGDGYPDLVSSDSETGMTVRYSRAGKTNLLKKVTNFCGGSVEMDYTLSNSCYEQPQRQWNLSSVTVEAPHFTDIYPKALTTFEYRNPNYNRYERMDYGYDTVITRQHNTQVAGDPVYRYTVQGFFNQDFQKRGRKMNESVYGGNGHLYIEKLYTTQQIDWENGYTIVAGSCPSIAYTSYEAEITRYYEQEATPQIVTEIVRRYDEKHNVTEYITKGDTSHTGEYLRAVISYREGLGHNLISLPDTIIVMDAQHDTLRKRTAVYDSCGRMVQLEQHYGDSIAEYDFTHDLYGNVDTMKFPHNYLGQRMFRSYKYDPFVYTYPTFISDAFGYSSFTDYDYTYGKPTHIIDINGIGMIYTYDCYGRLIQLTGPNEAASNDATYTIFVNYHPLLIGTATAVFAPDNTLCTITSHYDSQNPDNPIQTRLFSDGWGRPLQTKKDAELGVGECHVVSGKVQYDCFGRTVAQYYPFTEPLDQTSYNSQVDSALVTLTTYDILDRPLKVVLPTLDSTRTSYGFDTCRGRTYFSTTTTDPKGIAVSTLAGTRKQQVKSIAPMGAVTTFTYDPLGQLLQSTDPCGLSTLYTYDRLGRMVQRTHPDAGTDIYTYDGAGNMLAHVTQKLSTTNDSIRYHYTYNRLDSVICPETPINNVYYTYGSPTAPQGQRGKVTFLEDASGFQTFKYGKMGEVIENNHTFVLPNENHQYSFRMQYSYDSWNRVQTITYPDGEVVRYEYNLGGMLRKMEGQKGTQTFTYINDILYNHFGQKNAVWYGNGTHVEYSYDTLLRLSRLESWDVQGPMQHVNYNYDRAGNITCIQNSAGMASATNLGGTYTMNYTYDSLYRLQGSTGGLNGMKNYRYWLDMAYEANGRILRKSQLARTFTSTSSDTLMNYAYLYDYGATPVNNRVQSVADTVGTGPAQTFTWDANGDMLTQSTGTLVRTHCWDELNRLQGFSDSKYDACFLYDGSGERFYKFSGMPQSMMVNGQWSTYHSLTDPTLYASPYLVATPKGYTKHYYAESERVASKVGGGGLQELHSGCVSTVDFAAKKDSSLSHVQHIADCLGIVIMDMAENKLVVLDQPQGTATDPFYEEECYWYHPDHLGSTSWVSDKAGKGIQYLYYLPWGEELANQRATDYASRYTFSGKERDEETDYGYFGARYYNSDLSIWLSVDPMADKYPGLSPYTYCANNPVRLVDEDGREVEYNSFEDKLIVFISRIFDRSFRDKFNELKKSNEVYVFAKGNHIVGNTESESPFLSTDGKRIFINYFLSNDGKLGGETIFSMLKHETEHAMQFEYGEIGFANMNGTWCPIAYDLSDEYNANVEMYKGTLWRTGDIYIKWIESSEEQRIEALHKSYDFLYYNEENPQLNPINILFKERRQDSKIYALPYRPRQ
ncbi:MAG: SpvB/TcaC N-terminal domain-containing protein [Bacteroidales bacterium]|nr:SpvB/TcaC N-terminal domain-containing protein [Bacteroidales bacterium]